MEAKLNKNKKKYIIIMVLFILIVIIVGLVLYGYFKISRANYIYDGVKISSFDVSHMTKEEAFEYIKIKKENTKKETMKLVYGDMEYNISLSDIGLEFKYNKAIQEAYQIGREGNVFERLSEIIKTKKYGKEIELESSYSREMISYIVEKIAKDIDIEAKNAEFHFYDGNIEISDEIVGRKVDKEKLFNKIEENIFNLNEINIPVEDIIPKVSKDLLSQINGVIGEFSTSFQGSSLNRIENIKLSANAIKGTMLMPGESISFNETTGPREEKFGYKEASVIMNGEYTSGIGGGVCQTSTTLYNALLLADVTILERNPHSIPPSYVEPGTDAAVAYGYKDLKFRNDFDYPIYIDSKVIGNRIYFYIYGDVSNKNYTVKIEPEIVEVVYPKEEFIVDEKLSPGSKVLVQKGRNGYKVNTYKYIIIDGKIIHKELINKDYYKPKNYIYKLGK